VLLATDEEMRMTLRESWKKFAISSISILLLWVRPFVRSFVLSLNAKLPLFFHEVAAKQSQLYPICHQKGWTAKAKLHNFNVAFAQDYVERSTWPTKRSPPAAASLVSITSLG